ncbi:hypothetical protein QYS49_11855 [Marivirga salinae]|uniref:Ankyrin repeat domain-containing protein n=1 Tax=Marivirga salinarum TaxID=3059078 RepID=A0AA49GD25_9BACT|nr:hypothetical protein [Marivirga sp. BDSF4-3]WKK77718.2 hypothetical protein QYS49_11855 [Marivirga sp. BDSF4-3]
MIDHSSCSKKAIASEEDFGHGVSSILSPSPKGKEIEILKRFDLNLYQSARVYISRKNLRGVAFYFSEFIGYFHHHSMNVKSKPFSNFANQHNQLPQFEFGSALNDELYENLKSGSGFMDRIKPLIAQGADINARNLDKETIFQATASYYSKLDYDVIRYLVIEAGADINVHDDEYVTSLYSLVLSEDPERLKLFLELGANPNTITPDTFETVLDDIEDLHYSSYEVFGQKEESFLEAIEILKANGAKSAHELFTTEPKEYIAVNMFYLTFLVSKYGQVKVADLTTAPSILKEFDRLKELKQQHEDMIDEKMKSSFYKEIVGKHVRKINGMLEGLDVLKGVEIVR